MTDWHSRWESNKIGWHAEQVNQNLIDYFSKLDLADGDKIFVPLCGKSIDMFYLLKRGLRVVGVEMSEIAVEQFFSENKLEYSVAVS